MQADLSPVGATASPKTLTVRLVVHKSRLEATAAVGLVVHALAVALAVQHLANVGGAGGVAAHAHARQLALPKVACEGGKRGLIVCNIS